MNQYWSSRVDEIEAAIATLVRIDVESSRLSMRSVGFTNLTSLRDDLVANIHRAANAPREAIILNEVCQKGRRIKDVAAEFGISPSTVRRDMDRAQERGY